MSDALEIFNKSEEDNELPQSVVFVMSYEEAETIRAALQRRPVDVEEIHKQLTSFLFLRTQKRPWNSLDFCPLEECRYYVGWEDLKAATAHLASQGHLQQGWQPIDGEDWIRFREYTRFTQEQVYEIIGSLKMAGFVVTKPPTDGGKHE